MRLAFILSLMFTLSACGGSSSSGDRTTADFNKLVGVWDATYDDPDFGEDVGYLVIDSEGLLSFYDYAGDEYDNEGNCYWIDRDYAGIEAKGNNRYETTWFGDNETTIEIATVSGNTLRVRGEDEDAEDAEVFTKTNLRESDLVPECADELAVSAKPAARTQSATKVQSFKPKAH